jgi:hypothetical protein
MPLTTTIPAEASSRPSIRATSAPYVEQERADDGDGRPVQQRKVAAAAQVEAPRRIVNRTEQRRQLVAVKGRHGASSGGVR